MLSDDFFMQRAIQLAKNGMATAKPNPSVGAVIVCDNKIIGEGFTSAYGGPHAEVNAVNSVKDKNLLKSSIIYVTLEPCSHYGKTPPCADLLIQYKLKRVVIGTLDSNKLVAGKGIERLKKSGVSVTVGVLENQCREQLKRFFTNQEAMRPYIILKWAETKNGFIAPLSKINKEPVWISNEISQQLVHKWRAEEQAILVGTNTVFHDNPKLNVRHWYGNDPVRVVIDREMKIPDDVDLMNGNQKTILLVDEKTGFDKKRENVIVEKINFDQRLAEQICDVLYKHQISSLIVEGGAKTLQTFIDENIWDEAKVFVGRSSFEDGIKAPKFSGNAIFKTYIKNDILNIYRND